MKLSVKIAGIFAVVAFALTAVSANAAFTRDLTLGSTGADVTELQTWLESKGFLTIPAGTSKGYFGGLTQAALAKYQASVAITPAAGYFGPVTRAKVAMDGGTTTPSTPSTNDLSGGEASLEAFSLKSEDDAQEGEAKTVAIAEFDVEDADVQIDRVDVDFEFAGDDTQADDEPWKAFDSISLMVDGDEIAEADISDEDDWLDEDGPVFSFRLTEVDHVFTEGDTAEIEIVLTAQDNVDGADTSDATWIVSVAEDAIRGTDAEGIQQYIGGPTTLDEVTFEIDTLGEGEELTLKSSSADPDASTLLVDADDESEWHEAFIFKIEGEENDIELEDLVLTVTTTGDNYEDVIDDVKIEIDGEEYDDFEVADEDTTTADLTFDLDNEVTIDADEEVEVVVLLAFRSSDNYVDGTTTVKVSTVSVSGEGLDDVSDAAVVNGEVHTLSSSVAVISDVSNSTDTTDEKDAGTISFDFTVSAEDEDVTFDVADNADVNGSTDGVMFTVLGTDATIAVAGLTLVDGDATFNAGVWTINEGDEATFSLDVALTTVDAGDNGAYRVRLDSVAGSSVDEVSSSVNLTF